VLDGRSLVRTDYSSITLEHFRFTYLHQKSMEGVFFFRKKPLSSMDSVNTRIENALFFPIFISTLSVVPFQDNSAFCYPHLLHPWIIFISFSRILPNAR